MRPISVPAAAYTTRRMNPARSEAAARGPCEVATCEHIRQTQISVRSLYCAVDRCKLIHLSFSPHEGAMPELGSRGDADQLLCAAAASTMAWRTVLCQDTAEVRDPLRPRKIPTITGVDPIASVYVYTGPPESP